MTKSMFGIAMMAATLASSPAAARPTVETVSARVSIADLDLTSPAGQTMVQKRIKRAARNLCQSDDQWGLLQMELAADRCVREAVASAQPQIDRAVTYAFARKQGATQLALESHR